MSLLRRQSNDIKVNSTGSNSKSGMNRRHTLSTADRAETPAGTSAVPYRHRGSRLSPGVFVASTDNASTTGTGRGVNTIRGRKSLDKVCFCSHTRF